MTRLQGVPTLCYISQSRQQRNIVQCYATLLVASPLGQNKDNVCPCSWWEYHRYELHEHELWCGSAQQPGIRDDKSPAMTPHTHGRTHSGAEQPAKLLPAHFARLAVGLPSLLMLLLLQNAASSTAECLHCSSSGLLLREGLGALGLQDGQLGILGTSR